MTAIKLCATIAFVFAILEISIMIGFSVLEVDLHGAVAALLDTAILTSLSTPIIFLGFIRPYVGARDRAEQNLQKSEQRLRVIMNAVPDAVVVIDEGGVIRSFNPAAEKIFGYSVAEAIGQSVNILMPESEGAQHDSFVHRALESAEERFLDEWREVTAQRKDGSTFPLELGLSRIEVQEGVMFVGVSRDITQRKKAEEARIALERQLLQSHKMEAIGTLAGGIAHDVNNTLVPVIGLTEMMLEDAASDELQHENLTMIMTAAKQVRDLVSQILSFSREDGEQEQKEEIGAMVAEVLPVIRATTPATIDVQSKIDTAAAMIPVGSTRFHQILINLAANASHAMEGGGTLKISVEQLDVGPENLAHYPSLDLEPGRYARLSVKDSGCGMDEDTKSRIFDPFFTTRGVGEGTGLGLSVVHGIATACGGAITVSSALGQGTTIEVYFPAVTCFEHGERVAS